MKILFLDIDGVLATNRSVKRFRNVMAFDDVAVTQLCRVMKETGCKLVLSSSWRHLGWNAIAEALKAGNCSDTFSESDFLGKTPKDIGESRGEEIANWIRLNNFIDACVILDDDADMGELIKFLVQTDPEEGLTKGLADEVIRRLNA